MLEFEDKNYTWTTLRDTGEDFSVWRRVDFEGTVEGVIDFKVWGGGRLRGSLNINMTLDDGRKIRFPVWWNREYDGIKEASVGARLRVRFVRTRNGNYDAREITRL